MTVNYASPFDRKDTFKVFIATLPNLLLEPSIDDDTLRMINQIVLRFKEWVRKDFAAKQEAIIENAKKINVVGSRDENQSRLTICNLFYCIDSQIYY
ncbi:hypothetical protein X777_00075 [Ooceraea biroi]|uniref:Uncharacterized protein n=1 Tax=Ooceraea biroi TaxID=2015173 RepID=A0A026VUK6_OOCBI|nr:hypothetical protein X777_00075 [Ooceraea biroi]